MDRHVASFNRKWGFLILLKKNKTYVVTYILRFLVPVLGETMETCSRPGGGSLSHCAVGLKIILPPTAKIFAAALK